MKRTAIAAALAATVLAAAFATDIKDHHGVIVRHDAERRVVWPVFSADSAFEGAPLALEALAERGLKGSFFFTGNFLRDTANREIIDRIVAEGHYVGPHSDGHLLYADWDSNRTVIVPVDSLLADMRQNFAELARYRVKREDIGWLMPPFEWISGSQVKLVADSLGMKTVNPVPGLEVYRDYTTPDMPYYWTSEGLWNQFLEFEENEGLQGAILIMHLGTHPLRTDKFYRYLPQMLDTIQARGYSVERLP